MSASSVKSLIDCLINKYFNETSEIIELTYIEKLLLKHFYNEIGYIACEKGCINFIKYIIENKIVSDEFHKYALHIVSSYGYAHIADYLLEYDRGPNGAHQFMHIVILE